MRLTARALCGAARAAWRESFPLDGRDVARWFPGHMAKGLKKMQSSLKLVDCIIEVHDARIPLSGRNPLFQETLGLKPHLLVLNKMDLADLKEQQKIIQHLEGEGLKNVIFTNCVKDENIKQIIPMVTELVGSSYRYHRGENLEYCIMVIGVPNVGKSSLINSLRRKHLRKGKATRVGGEPGITRAVMSRIQVCERPLMFLLDTPGVLAPRIQSVETGLKLALCGTVLDHLVGEETLADYLLYTLNRHQLLGYVQHYGLGEACDDVASVLKRVAVKLRKTQKVMSTLSSPTTLRPPETSCEPSVAGCWAP
ncbi:mitochondrial ribosome-associated GTPase 1 isoform X2 [Physeter macrocephalus]|uniref:Mitochondrial ribosome-associated GTPase 1 n=1 Tax=Physeter macrocephalus TaxID=9755 RepID=A0A2Y9SFV7_PHYMC|nr:mitochondrial ribosome-associated GTPase 1 isoform X2 [Physeter catodon]|eukprot:XP_023977288.1 mitochondrial ribosome-associated GTPase 1 isoform X2 [Physeter catodon]